MELLLTDRLSCPRCGPAFGLILLANDMVDRRVRDGVLGCPNCRDSFPIAAGFADLRAPPRGELPVGRAGSASDDIEPDAGDVLALLGVAQGPGTVAFVGKASRYAAPFLESIEDVQVVVVDPDVRGWADEPGLSRICASPGLPFFARMLRGVVADGGLGAAVLYEAARVTAPLGRVVVIGADQEAPTVLEEAGLEVLAAEAGTVVAARS